MGSALPAANPAGKALQPPTTFQPMDLTTKYEVCGICKEERHLGRCVPPARDATPQAKRRAESKPAPVVSEAQGEAQPPIQKTVEDESSKPVTQSERDRLYRAKNREKINEAQRAYRLRQKTGSPSAG